MTDRKYGQRGYRESDKEGGGKPRKPSAPPTGGVLPSRTVLRCVDCGTILPSLTELPRQCPKCGSELHSCQQCAHFSPSQRFECTQPIPERIPDKRARNECTLFSLRATVARETSAASKSPDDVRRAFHDLFKK
jgi:hypothetical protein